MKKKHTSIRIKMMFIFIYKIGSEAKTQYNIRRKHNLKSVKTRFSQSLSLQKP